jgi:hypothetical protein
VTDPAGQWIISQPPTPYRRPCIVLPSLESEKHCGARSGEHTVLGYEICDECHDALYQPGLEAGAPVQILGSFGE